jgi:hypothetical protein
MKGFLKKGEPKGPSKTGSIAQLSTNNDNNQDKKGEQFSRTEQEGFKKVFTMMVENLPEYVKRYSEICF